MATKTIDIIKQTRSIPGELKEKRKEFANIRKVILKTLESGPKSIPQISEESKLPADVVMYYLMTLRKYGEIETGELDDMDEYFSYRSIPKKGNRKESNGKQ